MSTPVRAYAFPFFVIPSPSRSLRINFVEEPLFLIETARDFSTPLRFARNDKLLLQIAEQRGMCFLIGQRFGTLLAFFHDEFIQCRIDR
jgi:hypothetical protein